MAVRHLHTVGKGMETDEIYDVLMSQLIRAITKNDPKYWWVTACCTPT